MSNDLDAARHLALSGVPIFLAERAEEFPHGGSDNRGYHLPANWQKTQPDPAVLDDWEPGMAVCAVMGHVVDAIDIDPRNQVDDPDLAIPEDLIPKSYGRQLTVSGGTHDLVAKLGVRSKDGVLPGLDVKAGDEGRGHGFIYLAPTEREGKNGEIGRYQWQTPPNLAALDLDIPDTSGELLADRINRSRIPTITGPDYSGAGYAELAGHQREQADKYTEQKIQFWRDRLQGAAEWPEGYRDPQGRGWEGLVRDAAWSLALLATCPWVGMSETEAARRFGEILPEAIAQDPKCKDKWYSGLLERAAAEPVEMPPWADFDKVYHQGMKSQGLPVYLDETRMARWVIHEKLDNSWVYVVGLGWHHWDAKVGRWSFRADLGFMRELQGVLIDLNLRAMESGAEKAYQSKVQGMLSTNKVSAIEKACRAQSHFLAQEMDSHPDLLNVKNGVVDLETGELMPHDRSLLMSKQAPVDYVPGATHPDWDKCLDALDPEVVDWMQVRFGQAATGHMVADDVFPILQGGGSNGKTTLVSAIRGALGPYVVGVPEKLMTASSDSHPTELTTLHGARMAVVDETPETARLNVPRLKSVLGQEWITARKVHKDNMTWRATHSLFLLTNYLPIIHETDHGTWRRLALVKFEKEFPPDERFRARMVQGGDGIAEAVLAWLVEGAVRHYTNQTPNMPEKVREDTRQWRGKVDLLAQYLEDDRLVFSLDHCVGTVELYNDFRRWLVGNGHREWSDQMFTQRMEQYKPMVDNEVVKKTSKTDRGWSTLDLGEPPSQKKPKRVWWGLKWRSEEDASVSRLKVVR